MAKACWTRAGLESVSGASRGEKGLGCVLLGLMADLGGGPGSVRLESAPHASLGGGGLGIAAWAA